VTYGAESWTLTNKMGSLNDVGKDSSEENIWTNIRKCLLENKNESDL
jgi:hypothetical protein